MEIQHPTLVHEALRVLGQVQNAAAGETGRNTDRATIPKDAAPHFEAMRIETTARDEADMRHMVWCMLGRRASNEDVIQPVTAILEPSS